MASVSAAASNDGVTDSGADTARPSGARTAGTYSSSSSAAAVVVSSDRSLTRTRRSYPLNQPPTTTTSTARTRTGHHSHTPATTAARTGTAGGSGTSLRDTDTTSALTPSQATTSTHPLAVVPVVGWLVGGLVQWWTGPSEETNMTSNNNHNHNQNHNNNDTANTTSPIDAVSSSSSSSVLPHSVSGAGPVSGAGSGSGPVSGAGPGRGLMTMPSSAAKAPATKVGEQ